MKIDTQIYPQKGTFLTGAPSAVLDACARAKDSEKLGEYEAAREALSPYWQRIGDVPKVEGLSELETAHLQLRAGSLSGWIGSARQIPGAQEIAKDLISQAARRFEGLGLVEPSAEAKVALALCYWREGAYDEARVTLDDALHQLGDLDSEERLRAYLNRAIVERVSNRFEDALKTHKESAPLFERSTNDNLKSKFHAEYATVLKNYGLATNREDYIDQALVEYSAALFYVEQAGNKRSQAITENNLGYLFVKLGRYSEATKHLDRARSLFLSLKDQGRVAQVDDTRARALIARGSFSMAETVARTAVQALRDGDEPALLSAALATLGTALSRLGNFSKARATLDRAIQVARDAGENESSGMAALTAVEELREHLASDELLSYYRMAETELGASQHPEMRNRLGQCARQLIPVVGEPGPKAAPLKEGSASAPVTRMAEAAESAPGFSLELSLEEHVLRYEADLISRALAASDGSVTRAARMLGVTHQGLAFILNGRHKDLLPARRPVKRRRRSIIRYR